MIRIRWFDGLRFIVVPRLTVGTEAHVQKDNVFRVLGADLLSRPHHSDGVSGEPKLRVARYQPVQLVPSINSSCMRLANFLQPECFGRLHVGRFKSWRRLYSGVEV